MPWEEINHNDETVSVRVKPYGIKAFHRKALAVGERVGDYSVIATAANNLGSFESDLEKQPQIKKSKVKND